MSKSKRNGVSVRDGRLLIPVERAKELADVLDYAATCLYFQYAKEQGLQPEKLLPHGTAHKLFAICHAPVLDMRTAGMELDDLATEMKKALPRNKVVGRK